VIVTDRSQIGDEMAGEVIIDESGNAQPRPWGDLIASAAAQVRPPVVAQEFVGGLTSASRPQKLRCDDGNLYAVKFRSNPYGNGRAIFTEQVVALLGQLIGAPVPEVRLVRVTDELLALLSLDFNGQPATSGLQHGSMWQDNFSDRDGLSHVDQNRSAFGALRLLYSWLFCAGDHQFIYRNATPHDVLSVDHSCFLPDSTAWSSRRLEEHQDSVTLDPYFDSLGLKDVDHATALDRLEGIERPGIALVAATPPNEWGVSPDERTAFAEYVARRRIRLLEHFGRGPA
jgi:hypothetical protein